MFLIGLTGRKWSGKDTFCAALQTSARRTGRRVTRVAFGDLLKAEVAAACGVSMAEIDAEKEAFRPVLQWWGTDFRRRRHGKEYWVNQVRRRLASGLGDGRVYCLTDVRFPNEGALVRELGGVLVRLVRPQTERPDTHDSETAMAALTADVTILNDGCQAALDEVAAAFWAGYCIMHNLQDLSCGGRVAG